MSNAAPTINADEAVQRIYAEVHAPVFFQKLAALGIAPANDQEAEQLLEMGQYLHSQELAQQTGEDSSLVKRAYATLARDAQLPAETADFAVAAEKLASDPTASALADAILSAAHAG